LLQLTDTGTKPKPIQDVTPFCNKIRPCCFSLFVIRILIVQQNQESIYCERCFQVFILYVCPTNDHRLRCQKWLYCPLIKNNQSITISIVLQPLHGYVATQVLALYQGRRNTTKLLAHQTNKPQDHQATRPYVRPFNKPSRCRSSHPIEVSLTELDLLKIKIFARQDSNRKLAYITNNHLTHISTERLQELLSHGEMIIDNILNVFLEILCSSQGIYYLSTYFVSMLRLERNWARSKRWFARSLQHKKVHKPLMTSPVILIPCHVNGNHWVALVRRIIDGKVYFYYADDLNNPVTEKNIKELLQTTTDQSFFPADARWITCKSTTFRPHSNECGPRSLLALTVLGLHPHPHTDMLRPYMHANLAQILRTWVASTIITGHIKLPANIAIPFTNLNNGNSSFPQSLILWNESEQSLVQPGLPKSKNHEYQPTGTLSLIGSSQEDKPLQPLPTTNSSIPPDHQQQKKYIRWKRQHHKHQTSIRKFIVSHQPTIYDFKFFKPQKKVTKEDPEVWGHVMERIDPNETLRVVLQNPNGISPHFSFSDFLFSLHVCENIGVGVLAMPETNLDWKPSQIASTKRCFKRNWQHSSMQYSHSAEEF